MKRFHWLLRFADAGDGGTAAVTDQAAAPPVTAEPPIAATIIANGERDERTVQLEQELQTERGLRKKAETDAAHALDENHRLKQVGLRPTPPITEAAPDDRSDFEKFWAGE